MDRYDVGDTVRLEAAFTSDAGDPAEPETVVLIARTPDGVDTEHGATSDGDGVYHVDLQPATPGTWAYRWVSTGAVHGAEPGMFCVRPEFYPPYRPSLPAVAAKVRSRLYTVGGQQAPTFGADTTPTGDQAEECVDTAVAEVLGALPAPDVPDSLTGQARNLMTLRAAMEVELAYYGDQTTAQASAYEHWRDLYNTGLKALIAAVRDQSDGTRDGGVGVPTHTFPPGPPLEW